MQELPPEVWRNILKFLGLGDLVQEPNVIENMRLVAKQWNTLFSTVLSRCFKIILQVTHEIKPNEEVYVKLYHSTDLFAASFSHPMRKQENSKFTFNLVLPMGSSVAYGYEVRAGEGKANRNEFAVNKIRILRTADLSLLKNVHFCDDKWGEEKTEIDKQKLREPNATLTTPKSCVILNIGNNLMTNSPEVSKVITYAENIPDLSGTYCMKGTSIAFISYADGKYTLNISSLSSETPARPSVSCHPPFISIPVSHGHAGPMHIVCWGDKLLTDAEDHCIAVYDWKGNKETVFHHDINRNYLINVDWVKDFEIWNNHLVTSGQNKVRVWEKSNYMCIKQWDFSENESIRVVWNNLLAVTTKNDIVLIDWDGNIVQTLRGHTGAISSLQFYRSHLISCGSFMDKTVKVWNIKGECVAIFDSGFIPNAVTVCANSLIVSSTSNSRVQVFDWNI